AASRADAGATPSSSSGALHAEKLVARTIDNETRMNADVRMCAPSTSRWKRPFIPAIEGARRPCIRPTEKERSAEDAAGDREHHGGTEARRRKEERTAEEEEGEREHHGGTEARRRKEERTAEEEERQTRMKSSLDDLYDRDALGSAGVL